MVVNVLNYSGYYSLLNLYARTACSLMIYLISSLLMIHCVSIVGDSANMGPIEETIVEAVNS